MQLDNYIRLHDMTTDEFASLCGLPKMQVHYYRHGQRWPSPQALMLIRQATNGEVTADDFVDLHNGVIEPAIPKGVKMRKPVRAAALAVKAPPVKPAKGKAKRATAAQAAEAAE